MQQQLMKQNCNINNATYSIFKNYDALTTLQTECKQKFVGFINYSDNVIRKTDNRNRQVTHSNVSVNLSSFQFYLVYIWFSDNRIIW
jgi:hypothetical protein